MSVKIKTVIGDLLESKHVSIDQMAKDLKLPRDLVKKIINDFDVEELKTVMAISEYLGTSLDQLVGKCENYESNFEKIAKKDSVEDLQKLVSFGANIYGFDVYSNDLLSYAIKYQSKNIIKYLVSDYLNSKVKKDFIFDKDIIKEIIKLFLTDEDKEFLIKLNELTDNRVVLKKDKDGFFCYDNIPD